MCSILFLVESKRWLETIKKVLPIKTWRPWKPVAIKKVDPNTESDKEKDASIYSNPCNIENITPKEIVKYKDRRLFCLLLLKIEWWHQVTVTPEEIKSKVLSKGMFIGLKGTTLRGGQTWPNSKVGEILLWKKRPKKGEKK